MNYVLTSSTRNKYFFFKKKFFYLFIEKGREGKGGREGDSQGEKHQCEKHWLVPSHKHPAQGPNLQRRHVPGSEIELATFHFVGLCPTEQYLSGPKASISKDC